MKYLTRQTVIYGFFISVILICQLILVLNLLKLLFGF